MSICVCLRVGLSAWLYVRPSKRYIYMYAYLLPTLYLCIYVCKPVYACLSFYAFISILCTMYVYVFLYVYLFAVASVNLFNIISLSPPTPYQEE